MSHETEVSALGGLTLTVPAKAAKTGGKMQIPFNRVKVEGEWSGDPDTINKMRFLHARFAKVAPGTNLSFGPTEAKRAITMLVDYAYRQLGGK